LMELLNIFRADCSCIECERRMRMCVGRVFHCSNREIIFRPRWCRVLINSRNLELQRCNGWLV
jgi:hypothetical protein